jgi:hypothetical protein
MFDKRESGIQFINEKTILFERTIKLIYENILEKTSASTYSKTLFEGFLYGVVKNIDSLEKKTTPQLKKLLNTFTNLPDYSLESLKEGLSAREKVTKRLTAAENCFSK